MGELVTSPCPLNFGGTGLGRLVPKLSNVRLDERQ